MGRFLESAWFTAACAACLGIAVIGVGCGVESAGERAGLRVEGTEPGDCEDGADNDADGFFDCDDSGCAAAPLCDGSTGGTSGTGGGVGGTSGAGGTAGTSGGGGTGGSMLCADVDCDDQNECTEDSCDPMDGKCLHMEVIDGTNCDFDGLPGVCSLGECEDAMLCAGVDCDDSNECTVDVCDPLSGECGHTNVVDDTACDFGDLPGLCLGGACEDAMLCAGVECDDSNECTEDVCDPKDGQCVHTNVMDDTACDLGRLPGVCRTGVCENGYDYEVIDLGPIGSSGTMRGVNNAGQIIGNSTLSGSSKAFAIDNGTVVDLHTLFGATLASDINDAGQIVGRASAGAFRHTLSSGTTVFISGGWAFGVNEAGSVVGSAGGTNGHAFVWRDTNTDGLFDVSEFVDLDVLSGDVSSRAYAINDDDQIVGFSNDAGSFTRPVVWENDALSPLNLGTPNQATAEDINNSGVIVGHIGDFGVGFTSFLFEPVNDVTTHLGSGIARGINNQGAVVGGTAGGSFPSPAFLWTSDDGFRALDDLVDPTLGWTLVRAWDINELGWIVGEGNLAGERHGFVLIPY